MTEDVELSNLLLIFDQTVNLPVAVDMSRQRV